MAQSDLPLAPAAFLILFALTDGAKHGYAIMQETRKISDDGFRMGPATLYTTIQRLLDSGWIKEVSGPENSDSRRRYYRLTESGRALAIAEAERMERLVATAREKHLLRRLRAV